ncbi:hypothetical protein DBV15_02982, partial [Temnothorax longispinosus]
AHPSHRSQLVGSSLIARRRRCTRSKRAAEEEDCSVPVMLVAIPPWQLPACRVALSADTSRRASPTRKHPGR